MATEDLELTRIKGMNVFERLHAIQSEVEAIAKKGKVEFGNTKYKYAKEADFVEAVRPLISKYRLSIGVQMEPIGPVEGRGEVSQVRIAYQFYNIDNPKELVVMSALGQGQDKGDKGIYKAITGAKKYLLANAFMIPTHDDPELTDFQKALDKAAGEEPKSSTSFRKPKKETPKVEENDDL